MVAVTFWQSNIFKDPTEEKNHYKTERHGGTSKCQIFQNHISGSLAHNEDTSEFLEIWGQPLINLASSRIIHQKNRIHPYLELLTFGKEGHVLQNFKSIQTLADTFNHYPIHLTIHQSIWHMYTVPIQDLTHTKDGRGINLQSSSFRSSRMTWISSLLNLH